MSVLGIQNMFLNFLRVSDINQGIEEYGKTIGAVFARCPHAGRV